MGSFIYLALYYCWTNLLDGGSMICCSTNCERYNECGNTVDAAKDTFNALRGYYDTIEHLYTWGTASIGMDTEGNVISEANYVCGPLGNWGLFFPKNKPVYETLITGRIK